MIAILQKLTICEKSYKIYKKIFFPPSERFFGGFFFRIQKTMRVSIKIPSKQVVFTEIDNYDSVFDVKKKLQDITFIPVSQQRLLYNGKELTHGEIVQYSLHIGSKLFLKLISQKMPFPIYRKPTYHEKELLLAPSSLV